MGMGVLNCIIASKSWIATQNIGSLLVLTLTLTRCNSTSLQIFITSFPFHPPPIPSTPLLSHRPLSPMLTSLIERALIG